MNNKTIKVVLLLSIFVIVVGIVSAGEYVGEVCFPRTSDMCSRFSNYGYDCVCKNTYYTNGQYYCDLDNIVSCKSGCDFSTNKCRGMITDCILDQQRCCVSEEGCSNNQVQALTGDVYICVEEGWTMWHNCDVDETCKELASNKAVCEPKNMYYCTVDNIVCYKASSYNDNCYTSYEDCMNSREVVCLNAQKSLCVKKRGTCFAGEQEFRGTDLDDVYKTCQEQITTSKTCNTNTDCDDNNLCTKDVCETKMFIGKICENTVINDCDERSACSNKKFLGFKAYELKEKIGEQNKSESYCTLKNEVYYYIIGLISLLFVIIYYRKNIKKMFR